MKTESVILGISGAFFGLLVGWMLGSQSPSSSPAAPPVQTAAAPAGGGQAAAPALDLARARELEAIAEREPSNAEVRTQLGNLYFDAERYDQAIRWYEDSLRVDPRNPNVSTDLGVSYYYTNQPDRALAQFEHSLSIDPSHTKTILNTGIVRAFGKQDLEGAAAAWERVIALAPDSPEGQAAKQALDSMRTAHPAMDGTSAPAGAPPAQP